MNFEIPSVDILIKKPSYYTRGEIQQSRKRVENGRKNLLKHVPIKNMLVMYRLLIRLINLIIKQTYLSQVSFIGYSQSSFQSSSLHSCFHYLLRFSLSSHMHHMSKSFYMSFLYPFFCCSLFQPFSYSFILYSLSPFLSSLLFYGNT